MPAALPVIPPGTAPLFAGAPPARLIVSAQPLDVDPQGFARWLVRARFADARGRPTELLRGGDVDFVPSRGSAQWQTRLRFDGPAAIVSTVLEGPLAVRVGADVGVPVAAVSVTTDTRRWTVARVVARPLGPRAVSIGWFPQVSAGAVQIERSGGSVTLARAQIAPPSSSFVDTSVVPGTTYTYDVRLPGGRRSELGVQVPPQPQHADPSAIAGKKMWLSFSPWARDPDAYTALDPAAIVARAQAAGLRAIALRVAYGPFDEITSADEPAVDALIDGAAAHGIATIAWTVPRSTSFEDLATETALAQYSTAKGNGFAALAVDLERGDYFLGDGAAGYAALGGYLRVLRAALGPTFPLVATVEDPYLEQLTRASYPYDAIAASADVMQPMVYWRMLSRQAVTPDAVRSAIRGSFDAVRREAGRAVPIDMGLQSSGDGPRGAPPPAEIAAAIDEAHALGALGVTFFDWGGTSAENWRAIGAAPW